MKKEHQSSDPYANPDWINIDGNNIHRTAIVFSNVKMGYGNIIGPYAVIGSNGEIRNAHQGEFGGRVIIGDRNVISEHVTIQRPFDPKQKTVVGSNNIIMAHAHIGHDAVIGDNCEICTSSVIGGYTTIEDGAKIKLNCVVRNRVTVGKLAIVGLGSTVTKDIPTGAIAYGNPAKVQVLPKVVIHVAVWKRPRVLRVFLESITRLMREVPEIDLHAVIVRSPEDTTEDVINRANPRIHVVEAPNNPLGAKLNEGIRAARELNPDYIIGLGSDDIMSTTALKGYIPHMKNGVDLIALKDLYVYDTETNTFSYFGGYGNHRTGETVGPGRMMSKRLLNMLDWEPWDGTLDRNLDGSLQKKLKNIPLVQASMLLTEMGGMLVDIKTDENIGRMKLGDNHSLRKPSMLREHFSEGEVEAIFNLKAD